MTAERDEDEAIEAGVTAASEEVSRRAAWNGRWRWGEKEQVIAETAALATLHKWQQIEEHRNANSAARSAS
jgi:hypothetical protein